MDLKYKGIQMFKDFYLSMKNGIRNFYIFRKVIWEFRWWDCDFQIRIIETMLIECEKNYGVNSHFVGHKFTRKRIQVILKYIDLYKNEYKIEKEYIYYNKIMKYYGRNLRRFWD